MPTTPTYDHLLTEISDELQRQVLEILAANPQGISRSSLIAKIYGVWVPQAELASSTYDRKIRLAIKSLRKMGFSIVSSSGKAGYHLSEDPEEIQAFAAEQASRAAHETTDAREAHAWPLKIKSIQEYRRSNVGATQERLI